MVLLAVAALATAVFLARGPVDRWLARGDLERARGAIAAQRVDDAASALAAALRRNPRLGSARQALGELELRRGRLEEAFLQFQALSDMEPENPVGWDGLAQVRTAAGQQDAALSALDVLLGLAPDLAQRRIDRAELRLRRGRFRGASLDAAEVLRSDPRNSRAWSVLARSTAAMQGRAAGVEVAERATRQTGADPALAAVLAEVRTAPEQPVRPPPLLDPDVADRTEYWPGALGTAIRELLIRLARKDSTGAAQLVASARAGWSASRNAWAAMGNGYWKPGSARAIASSLSPVVSTPYRLVQRVIRLEIGRCDRGDARSASTSKRSATS